MGGRRTQRGLRREKEEKCQAPVSCYNAVSPAEYGPRERNGRERMEGGETLGRGLAAELEGIYAPAADKLGRLVRNLATAGILGGPNTPQEKAGIS